MEELVSEAELDTFISEGMQHSGFREEFEKAFDSIELKEAFRKWFKPFYGRYGRLDWEKNLNGDFESVWIEFCIHVLFNSGVFKKESNSSRP